MPKLLIEEVLKRIEQPATPRTEFADELLAAFMRELEVERPTRERARPAPPAPLGRNPVRFRRSFVVAGTAVLVAVVAILVILVPSTRQSALAVIEEAQRDFADVPPFHATLARRVSGDSAVFDEFPEHDGEDWVHLQEFWYRDQDGWRREIVEDSLPFMRGGKGSFIVWGGEKTSVYNAHENTFYVREGEDVQFSPLIDLSPEPTSGVGKLIQTRAGSGVPFETYFEDWCEVLPDDRVAGRVTRHLTCEDGFAQLWLDAETGLILKFLTPESRLEVETIEYGPSFSPDQFEFEPPSAAESAADAAAQRPATGLAVGEVAPAWSGPLLSGGQVDLEGLRGKPVAVYFWASWCPGCIGDPLDNFDTAYKLRAKEINFVSVSYDSETATRTFLAEQGPYQVPIVIDGQGSISGKWELTGIPTLVLLDADGRLLNAYLGPVSAEDLRSLLDALAAGKPLPQITPEDT